MKHYVNPELHIVELVAEDILTLSDEVEIDGGPLYDGN